MLTGTLFWGGGSSTWNTSTSNWALTSGGTADQYWPNNGDKAAVFDGTGGSVSVASGISATSIEVSSGDYTFVGSPIGISAAVQIDSGSSLTANQVVAGSLSIGGTAGNPSMVTIAGTQNGTPPAILYWDGGSTGTLNWNSTNWSPNSTGGSHVAWTSGSVAIFNGAGGTISLASGISANQIIFATQGYTLSSGSLAVPVVSVNKGVQATISSQLNGTSGLNVTGGGTLVVSGANNTYTGATILTSSTLKLGASTALGSTFVGTSPTHPGILDLNGQSIGSSAPFDLFPGTVINSSATQARCASDVNDGNNNSNIIASTLTVSGAGTITLSGVIDGNASSIHADVGINKTGTSTLILTGQETYGGKTTINGGTLQLGSGSALYNSAITVAPRATFAVRPGAGTVNAGDNLSGTGGATLDLGPGSTFDMRDVAIGAFNLRQQASFTGTPLEINNATLGFDLDGATGGVGNSDQLHDTGSASISGVNTINITALPSGVTANSIYTIISASKGITFGSGASFVFDNGTNTEILGDHNSYKLTLGTATTSGIGITGITISVANYDDASDPTLLAAVRQALAIPTDQPVTQANWQQLTSLSVDSNYVQSLNGIQNATNLQTLTLVPSDFHKPGYLTDSWSLLPLSGLTKLTSVTLQDCGMTDSTLDNLPSLQNLQTLDLRYNGINLVWLRGIDQTKLTRLLLHGNPLGGGYTDLYTHSPWNYGLSDKLLTVDIAPTDPQKVIEKIDPANPTATYTALAAAFYNLPIEIYQYLLNTIQYQAYNGQMKGPLAVLETGAGNDWDTEALLVQLFAAAEISSSALQYHTTRVWDSIGAVENWLGVQSALGVFQVLSNAGLEPELYSTLTSPTPLNGSTDPNALAAAQYAKFDHTWLEWTTGGQKWILDPSWKSRDYQPGIPSVVTASQLDPNSIESAFLNQAANSPTINELASEYYEDQVRKYLADPNNKLADKTIADVPYTGPIHPQILGGFSTSITQIHSKYDSSFDALNSATSIPAQYEWKVQVSEAATQGGSSLVAATLNIPDISLRRLTVFTGTTSLAPHIYLDGSDVGGTASALPSGTNSVYVTIQVTPGGTSPTDPLYSTTHYTQTYNRLTNKYLAVGLDANQTSAQLLAGLRKTLDATEINQANNPGNSGWFSLSTANQEQLVGAFLQLAAMQFFNESDTGKDEIFGVMQSVPLFNYVASGLTTGDPALKSTTLTAPYDKLQFPFVPSGLDLDLPNGWWNSESLTGDSSQDANRFNVAGHTISAMEANIWAELTNTPSLSTTVSIQLAYQAHQQNPNNNNVVTISNASAVNTNLQNMTTSQGLQAAVEATISGYLNLNTDPNRTYDYQIVTPVKETPVGTDVNNEWVGVGFIVQRSLKGKNLWKDNGWLIQGYSVVNGTAKPLESAHGGINSPALPNTVTPAPLTPFQTLLGDPINAANGDVVRDDTDFSIPNLGAPLGISRHYHSSNTVASGTSWSDQGMGDGWSFTYSDTISAYNSTVDGPQQAGTWSG